MWRTTSLFVITFLLALRTDAAVLRPDPPDDSQVLSAVPILEGTNRTLADLRRYRQQLEAFRSGVLEVYNQTLEAYTSDLSAFSRKLELNRSRGTIDNVAYEEEMGWHNQEIRRCSNTGKYLRAYLQALAKYKAETDWAVTEIRRMERELL